MILLWLSTILLLCDSYKILVMNPKYAYSHMNFMGKIADTLVEAGHEVVTFQPIIEPLHVGNGTTKSRLIQSGPYPELATEMDMVRDGNHLKPLWTASATNPVGVLAFVPVLSSMTEKALTNVLDDKEMLQQLKNENFDVAIAELFDFIGIGVLEAIGLKNIVGAHTCALMEGTSLALGVPVLPSFMPASLGVTNDSTDLWTRATNLLFTYLSWYFQTGIASAADRVMKKKLGPNVTPVWDTVSNISWVLVNSEPLMEFEGPTLRKIIDIGGIGVHEPKPLNEEWDRVLNLRKQTILISFGTVAQSIFMPESMKKAIINVVKSFPNITFIWKYEEPNDAMFKGIDNLIASEWTPQSCLLADKRLTLFITHGGAGSMMESALRAKPLIVVPLFGDQTRNAKLMEKFGFGVLVEKARLLNSNVLRSAIERILSDSK
nr:UDP-glucuronosyl UDP-glucosyltransferase domain containing protein [Haemonchus contortus]